MAKDPSFPLYAQDFLMDVIQMPDDLVGAYIRLLCVMWINGKCHNSAMGLAMVSPLANKVLETIPEKFTFHKDGTITNNRLERERAKRIKNRELRRIAGKKGSEVRWQTYSKSNSKEIANAIAKDMAKEKDKEKDKEIALEYVKRSDPLIISLVKEFYDFQYPLYTNQLREFKKDPDKLIAESVDIIDKLIRLDEYDLGEVKETLEFAIKDDFWAPNVISLKGLRKKKDGTTKFDKIFSRMKRNKKKGMGAIEEWVND